MGQQQDRKIGLTKRSTRITLIGSKQGKLYTLYSALEQRGYHSRFLFNDSDAFLGLPPTDILIIDITVAHQPRSSQFVRVPAILVLAENANAQLPPWLQLQHVFLRPYPETPEDLIPRLASFLPEQSHTFNLPTHNTEHLALLFGITQYLSGHLDIRDLFERILDLAPYLNAEFSALLLVEQNETIYYRSNQPGRQELTGTTGRQFARRLIKNGLEGWVMRHQQTAIVADVLQDSRWLKASYLPDVSYSVVAMPVQLERVEAQGVFLLGHSRPGFFSADDIPLLDDVLAQICRALENALLFKNQSQRSVQLALINEVSQAATSILNLDVMLRTVVQAIRRSFAFYRVTVYLFNAATNRVELHAQSPGDRMKTDGSSPPKSFGLREGLVGWTTATKRTVLVNDVTRDSRYIPDEDPVEIRSKLCIPIVMGTKIIGVLDLQSTQLEAFERYHVSALETLADQLAIAIENARLYDTINRHVDELTSLNQISQAINASLDLQETLTVITDQTIRLMNVAAASVVLHDEQRNDVWFAAASGEGAEAVIGRRIPYGQGIAGWVTESGSPVIVPDVSTDKRFFADMDRTSGFTTRSIMCVPLQTRGHTIGAIEVMNKRVGTFNQDDVSLLQAFAAPAATAIENAQLYQEKTQTIARLADTQRQLIQTAKLAAVGELAAGVAHEINNPLTSIIGLTSLVLESPNVKLDEVARTDLNVVSTEAGRARDIVRRLLNFARADAPKRQKVDFNQLVEEAILLVYTKSVSYQIELKKSLSQLPEMYLDVNQIKQVLVNLLNNAVYAMQDNPKPAILTVTTQLESQPVPGHPNKTAAVMVCKIKDTGPGINPEHLDNIFDPFFTTKEVGEGTGLGLSISYGIVEQHNGTISVESQPGQGATFTVTLPIDTQNDDDDRFALRK